MISRLWAAVRGEKPEPKEEPVNPQVRGGVFSTELMVPTAEAARSRAQSLSMGRTVANDRVIDAQGVAMDSNSFATSAKAVTTLHADGVPDGQLAWYGSQGFIGYQQCAILAQNWLIDKACSMPARDAVRGGYKFTLNNGQKLTPRMSAYLEKSAKRFKLNQGLVEHVRFGRIFGIRISFAVIDSQDPDFYVKPFNPDGVTPGSYKGMTQVDPYWCIPELSIAAASNPSAIDFYEPTYWIINGVRYHKSHLIIMRGPAVADILKPAYLYGGLSIPQMIYERVYAAERTANEAPQLALTKRSTVFYTAVDKAFAKFDQFVTKVRQWTDLWNNFGIKVADKDADKVEQIDTNLTGLDEVIMTQYQLVAAVANVPATKLLGTTPKGFNSSGDYETDSYHEEVNGIQVNDMEPYAMRHMTCLIRSEIVPQFGPGAYDFDITWQPLKVLNAKDQAAVNLQTAQADQVWSTMGAIDGHDVRERLAKDETSGYGGIEVLNDEPSPTDDPQAPAVGGAAQSTPNVQGGHAGAQRGNPNALQQPVAAGGQPHDAGSAARG